MRLNQTEPFVRVEECHGHGCGSWCGFESQALSIGNFEMNLYHRDERVVNVDVRLHHLVEVNGSFAILRRDGLAEEMERQALDGRESSVLRRGGRPG